MIKRFFAGLWRAITVLRLALANLLFLAILVILWMTFNGKPTPLPDNAALFWDLSGRVVDVRSRVDASALLFEQNDAGREILLTDLVDSARLAAKDPRINSLIVRLDRLVAIGQSKTTELAEALDEFRASGKPIVAFGDYFTQDQYRVAVEADTILMHPQGVVALEGFSYYINFFAEALEKLSVSMHVFRVGDFKSIAEPYLRSDMSEGEREIAREWLTQIWKAYSDRVEQRRSLDPGAVDALLNNFPERLAATGGNGAQLAIKTGLVDELYSRPEQRSYLQKIAGASDNDLGFEHVGFTDYLSRSRQKSLTSDASVIAVVSAEGAIMPGRSQAGVIGADTVAKQLSDAAARTDTKALVLRVNSGGGSAFASELIREELARISAAGTPVVVSMGAVAASGGYYLAVAGDEIVATPTTITGSIGVFAAFPTFERLLERGGVYTDGLGTTAYAGGLRPDRPLAPAIEEAVELSIANTYEHFVALVAEGRGLDRATVEQYAQGRVLSASDALAAGLVDRLGSLDEAIEAAAALAGLGEDDYEVISVQPAFSPQEILLQQLSDNFNAKLLKQPGLSGLLALLDPVQKRLNLLGSLRDPQNVFLRCLPCEGTHF
ncbi:MAG: signal peptide peptidase SppA [Pseudomonadota bacterium]